MGPKRRDLLRAVAVVVPTVLSGCSSDPTTGGPSTDHAENTSPGGGSGVTGTETRDGPPVSDLERNCITAEFSGYVSTTPVPTPTEPEPLDRDSAGSYAVAYERYYNRYLALYSMGPPTPESTDLPTHGLPEVTLKQLDPEVRADREDGYVVRLSYERYFEDERIGEYTVTYLLSEEYTVRAETEGEVVPGPDPTETGEVMTC